MNKHDPVEGMFSVERGYSLLEIMVVVGLIGVVSAIAVPMFGNSMADFRISGDARSASNTIALGKMRAASVFSRVRIFVDLPGKSYRLETFDKTSDICCWLASSGSTHLAQGVSFGYGVVGTAPPDTTQPAIGHAAKCKTDTDADIANTACVIFNSRGIPIDSIGNPVVDTLYVTNGSFVYAVAVSASGMIRSWRTSAVATPKWVLQ
jgi:prepilin-type N-terminal cleavage/methylation domain-containing protein